MSSYLKIPLITVSAVSYSYSLLIMFHSTFSSSSIMKISAEKKILEIFIMSICKGSFKEHNFKLSIKKVAGV